MLEQAQKQFALRRSVRDNRGPGRELEWIVGQRGNFGLVLREGRAAQEQSQKESNRGPGGHGTHSHRTEGNVSTEGWERTRYNFTVDATGLRSGGLRHGIVMRLAKPFRVRSSPAGRVRLCGGYSLVK